MSTLERAIEIAAQAHAGQCDKGGAPYILHPLRVMFAVRTPVERIVAVLHDLMEDSKHWTPERLRREGFDDEIIEAVEALTRREGEDYLEFVRRAGKHAVARAVKIADLHDNMDLSRIPEPNEKDHARMERYQKALQCLEEVGRSGE